MNKRTFIKTLAVGSLALILKPNSGFSAPAYFSLESSLDNGVGGFKLPELGFKTDALEPYIDAKTMQIHYTKHHVGYVMKLNDAVKGTKYAGQSLEYVLQNVKDTETDIRNNVGGHYNHSLFWKLISPSPSRLPLGHLATAIDRDFGTFEKMKEEFEAAAKTRFGSGWAWLCVDKKGKLFINSTANQDNPMMSKVEKIHGYPVLGLDVWEHAYYLKYQNKRPDYIKAFWNITNWVEAENRFNEFKK